jgi:hypothetical protein
MKRVVAEAGGDPNAPDFGLLTHVSPIQWDNVTLYRAYDIRPRSSESAPADLGEVRLATVPHYAILPDILTGPRRSGARC